jgi:hypothetical protein
MTAELFDLLGGAERRTTRPRGFAPWNPQPTALALLAQVQDVLAEYTDYLPLTCRQVFYRLVGAQGFDKTEQAYQRLCETLSRARRARLIEMDAIRDDGGHTAVPPAWEGTEDFLGAVRSQAERLILNRSVGQRTRLVVMCEAAGMVPQLASVARHYGLPVISSGGFESVTEKHRLAVDLAEEGRPTEVLHIGDHDPSGAHLFLALAEDVQAFTRELGGDVEFSRLAVTPRQITKLRLATAPPKATDRRAFKGETCQAEAIPPDVLAGILREAIEARIDHEALARVFQHEKRVRSELVKRLTTTPMRPSRGARKKRSRRRNNE